MCTCFLRAVLGQIGLEERAAADARVDWEVGVEQVLKNLDYLDKVCAARFPLFFGNHVRWTSFRVQFDELFRLTLVAILLTRAATAAGDQAIRPEAGEQPAGFGDGPLLVEQRAREVPVAAAAGGGARRADGAERERGARREALAAAAGTRADGGDARQGWRAGATTPGNQGMRMRPSGDADTRACARASLAAASSAHWFASVCTGLSVSSRARDIAPPQIAQLFLSLTRFPVWCTIGHQLCRIIISRRWLICSTRKQRMRAYFVQYAPEETSSFIFWWRCCFIPASSIQTAVSRIQAFLPPALSSSSRRCACQLSSDYGYGHYGLA